MLSGVEGFFLMIKIHISHLSPHPKNCAIISYIALSKNPDVYAVTISLTLFSATTPDLVK